MFSNFNTARFVRKLSCILIFISTFLLTGKAAGQIPPIINDSITIAVAPDYDSVSNFHRFWLGESYRKLWAAPVKIRVFHLNKEKGGLSIVQMRRRSANEIDSVERPAGTPMGITKYTKISRKRIAGKIKKNNCKRYFARPGGNRPSLFRLNSSSLCGGAWYTSFKSRNCLCS